MVLKGAGTVVAGERGQLAIADVGNPGMATGGMGDVLSGIIGALLAQKLSLYDAACAGCVVHGAAGTNWPRGKELVVCWQPICCRRCLNMSIPNGYP